MDLLFINPGTEKSQIQTLVYQDELDKDFYEFLKNQNSAENLSINYNREPPSGILLLSAIMEKAGYQISFFDCSNNPNYLQDLDEYISNYKVFALTCLTNTFHLALKIANHIKYINSQAIIILGGPHASFLYQDILNEYPVFDIIAVGECEEVIIPMMNLLFDSMIYNSHHSNSLSLDSIPKGFAIRKNSKNQICFLQEFKNKINEPFDIFFKGWPNPVNINNNPLPARHLLSHSYNVANISFNRGCPNNCSFCSRQKLFKSTVRIRNIEHIQMELIDIINCYNYSFLNFYDNINFNHIIFRQFLEMLIKLNLKIPWGCELRADLLTEEDCIMLKKAGCIGVATGIESSDKFVLKTNFKEQDPIKVKQGIINLKKFGLVVQTYFVIGLPGDNMEKFTQTLKYLRDLPLDSQDEINFFIATPYPGSQLFDKQQDFGIKISIKDYHLYDCNHFIFTTKDLLKKEIYTMYKKAINVVNEIKQRKKE